MREFRIIPSILASGEPAWTLIADWSIPGFSAGSTTLATNTDRAVLERAIEHLKQPAHSADNT